MTFRISEDMIKERKKLIVIMAIFTPIMMTVFFLLYASQGNGIKNVPLSIMILAGISLFIILEFFIVSKIMIKKIRSIILNFDEQGFIRINGKKTERFEFNEMTDVKITKKEGQYQKMIIRGKCSKKAFILGGFENMIEMNTLFETSVKTISRKEQKIDWSSPIVMMITMGITFLIMALLIIVNGDMFDFVSPLIQFVFGIYFVAFKPISKSAGTRFKNFEYIMGGLLILCGSAVLISVLLEL